MRLLIVILSLFIFKLSVNAQSANEIIKFSDSNLKAALLEFGNTPENPYSLDTNKDNEISISEAEAYGGPINIQNKNINSLDGLQYFKNISDLNCSGNNLNVLDLSFLGSNFAALNCSNNNITSLTLPENLIYFSTLECQNNKLTFLDMSSYVNLFYLNASNNSLLYLNLAIGNPYLDVDARNNTELTCIETVENPVTVYWKYDPTVKLGTSCESSIELPPLVLYEITIKDNQAIINWAVNDITELKSFRIKKTNENNEEILVQEIKLGASLLSTANQYQITDPIDINEDVVYQLFAVNSSDQEGAYLPLPSTQEVLRSLPIVLGDYTLEDSTEGVRIHWSTLTEVNNAYFNIQRSLDGEYFETIGSVEGNGNTSQEVYYSFTDYEVKEYTGTVYYRLEQVDFDGQSEIFDILAFEFNNNEFSVYPSPINVNEALNIVGDNLNSVEMYSLTGEKLLSKSYNSLKEVTLNLEGYLPGVYILIVNGQSSKKIIIK